MIPKIIHYVWVGGNPKPKNIQRCMKTWSKHLQDYQIIEWNEHNFDIHENKYVEQAYQAKNGRLFPTISGLRPFTKWAAFIWILTSWCWIICMIY